MKITLAISITAVALLTWFAYSWRATLINAYEDSWLLTEGERPIHIAWPEFSRSRDALFAMEQMAERREWRELKDFARKKMTDFMRSDDDDERNVASLAMRYALLAESCLGRLPYNITLYPVRSPEDFVMFRNRGRDVCLFNMFFFRELGVPDEVFHQAMEYPLQFADQTHRSIRFMTEAAHLSGDEQVAQKLEQVAGITCNDSFSKSPTPHPSSPSAQTTPISPTQPTSPQPTSASYHPLRSNVFVFGDPMLTLFVRMLAADPTNRRLADYAALSFILSGNKAKCQQLLRMCPVYGNQPLPPIYR